MPDYNVVTVKDLSNAEFLKRYAGRGRVGLSGGPTLVDKAICRAQRHLHPNKQWGLWSHAFLFQAVRTDRQHWVIESDLQLHRKHIQLGVQENRISKYFDESIYSNFAVLDFGLTDPQVSTLLAAALELVANRAQYSLRELFGTLIALKHPQLRGRTNLLARERSMYCSAFVRHLFREMGVDLSPGIDGKNTTPEHISITPVQHTRYVLQRLTPSSRIGEIRTKVRGRIQERIARLKERQKKNQSLPAVSPPSASASPVVVASSAASKLA